MLRRKPTHIARHAPFRNVEQPARAPLTIHRRSLEQTRRLQLADPVRALAPAGGHFGLAVDLAGVGVVFRRAKAVATGGVPRAGEVGEVVLAGRLGAVLG